MVELEARKLAVKPTDGVVSRALNRRVSLFITTRFLLKTSLTPNQLTWIIFAISVQAVPAYLLGLYWLGGLIAQLGSVLDGCDGELARLKGMTSELGAFYDAVLDRYTDVATVAALTCRLAYDLGPDLSMYAWILGLMAVIGGLMTSYSWHLVKGPLGGGDVPWPALLSDSRDVRTLLLAVGSVLAHFDLRAPLVPLAWIALVTNAKCFYRLAVAARYMKRGNPL